MIPPVVASDRGAAQTRAGSGRPGVVGPRDREASFRRSVLESRAAAGESPVSEEGGERSGTLSSAGHE